GMAAAWGGVAPTSRLTTAFTVPSPPTATSSSAPPSTAERESSRRCSGCSEKSASPVRPRSAARRAISGQRRPVAPPAEAGLTRKTVAACVLVSDGLERELCHLVDRPLHVIVRDPDELAGDDDVAHDEEAPRLHLL